MRIQLVYAGAVDDERIQAPYSITKNLYRFLIERATVVYHQWDSKVIPEIDRDDVVIGHPHYDHETIIQQIFRRRVPCRAKCLIHPFHHRRVEDNFPFNELVLAADRWFAICGSYWTDTIEQTPFAAWKAKLVHLNMAVNLNHFPYLRTTFQQPDQRRLVYIGSPMPQKNLGLLMAILARLPHVGLTWYGGYTDHPLAQLPNVHTVGWEVLTIPLLQTIVNHCDIFINTSISDASPTAMLEAAAVGLVIACTKESGIYNSPMVTELKLDDLEYNIGVVTRLLQAPESDLLSKAWAARQVVEHHHTWSIFCERVWTELMKL